MELTKKQAIELHRELWDWLYHHPSKQKWEWSEWKNNGGNFPSVESDCFLCEYELTRSNCKNCLLLWPLDHCFNLGDGLFGRWEDARSPKTRKKYAKLIRDLKEKK